MVSEMAILFRTLSQGAWPVTNRKSTLDRPEKIVVDLTRPNQVFELLEPGEALYSNTSSGLSSNSCRSLNLSIQAPIITGFRCALIARLPEPSPAKFLSKRNRCFAGRTGDIRCTAIGTRHHQG